MIEYSLIMISQTYKRLRNIQCVAALDHYPWKCNSEVQTIIISVTPFTET